MLEAQVEARLGRLKRYGFAVYKLRTPGNSGVMDRMILWPTYFPGPPIFVELKRPGKEPRPLQEAIANDWRKRGVDVREYCDTILKVTALVDKLVGKVEKEREKCISG